MINLVGQEDMLFECGIWCWSIVVSFTLYIIIIASHAVVMIMMVFFFCIFYIFL